MNESQQEQSAMGTNVTKVEELSIVQKDEDKHNEKEEEETSETKVEEQHILQDDENQHIEREEETTVTEVEEQHIVQENEDQLTEQEEETKVTEAEEQHKVQENGDQHAKQEEEEMNVTEVDEQHIVQENEDQNTKQEEEETEVADVEEPHIVQENDTEPPVPEPEKPESPPAPLKLGVVITAHPVSRVRPRLQPYSTNQYTLRDAAKEQMKILRLMKLESNLEKHSASHEAMMKLATIFKEVHTVMTEKVAKLNRLETRLLMAEDAADCLTLHCGDSGFIWRIGEFKDKFKDATNGVNPVLYSPAFMAQGYKLALGLCPHGDGRGAKGKYMSVFFAILRGNNDELQNWPFDSSVVFSLLSLSARDRVNDLVATFVPDVTHGDNAGFLDRPTTRRNRMLGLRQFVAHGVLWKGDFVKDDVIYIRVQVLQSRPQGDTNT